MFPKKKTVNYSHVTYFIRFYWFYNIKVVEIGQAACSAKIKPDPGFSDFMQIRLAPCLNMLESKVKLRVWGNLKWKKYS